ncbi:hypothetical protein DSO57_1010929 [Entomophthora muscae]|uniref:Uncharacterized protein n=1 Tax=Entomophthora muscae TaxID=34485 RepID=A0ACC2SVT0_9FUNG|nr:hypothetical protein DSO57_1010929 [Entomophthora muscae]
MMLTTGSASLLVTLFPCTFTSPSPFVTEVPDPPKVLSHLLEEDITNSPNTPMVMVLSPGPLWAPSQLSFLTMSNLMPLCTPSSILIQWSCMVSKPQALPASKVPTKQVCDPPSDYPVTQSQTRKSTQITKSINLNR